jgi:predicted ATPase
VLSFTRPVTFLVGENGSGKSTFVEAIAEAYGINVRGGRAGVPTEVPFQERSILGMHISLDLSSQGLANKKRGLQGYHLRFEAAPDPVELVTSPELALLGHRLEELRARIRGEGITAALRDLMREPVLHLLDEPEAALSPASCVELVGVLRELDKTGAQVICATRSPLLTATPGADVIDLGGRRETAMDG